MYVIQPYQTAGIPTRQQTPEHCSLKHTHIHIPAHNAVPKSQMAYDYTWNEAISAALVSKHLLF